MKARERALNLMRIKQGRIARQKRKGLFYLVGKPNLFRLKF